MVTCNKIEKFEAQCRIDALGKKTKIIEWNGATNKASFICPICGGEEHIKRGGELYLKDRQTMCVKYGSIAINTNNVIKKTELIRLYNRSILNMDKVSQYLKNSIGITVKDEKLIADLCRINNLIPQNIEAIEVELISPLCTYERVQGGFKIMDSKSIKGNIDRMLNLISGLNDEVKTLINNNELLLNLMLKGEVL